MSRIPIAPVLVLAIAAVACTAPGAAPETPTRPELQTVLDQARTEQEAPGAILGVRFAEGDEAFWASGVASIESGRAILSDDPFQLGSISKTITAVVVLMLVEEGRLGLDDRLDRFLPGYPRAERVTVAQLLRHESGLPDFALYAYLRPDREEMLSLVTREWTRGELVDLAASLDNWFDDSQEWNYSNSNYFMLGLIVEEVTGRTLAEALRERIFEPLGLESTWLNAYEPARRELVVEGHLGPVEGWAHSAMFGELGTTTAMDKGNMEWGSGGVVSTAAEGLRFLSALLDGALLEPESLALVQQFVATPPLGGASALTAGDLTNGYGFGLTRSERPMGYTRVGHGSIYNGHQAGLYRLEPCGHTIALFVNRGFIDDRRMIDLIAAELGCGPGE